MAWLVVALRLAARQPSAPGPATAAGRRDDPADKARPPGGLSSPPYAPPRWRATRRINSSAPGWLPRVGRRPVSGGGRFAQALSDGSAPLGSSPQNISVEPPRRLSTGGPSLGRTS